MDMQLVLACLGIMGKGMLGIFTVILVIWALVALLNRITGKKRGEEPAQNAESPGRPTVCRGFACQKRCFDFIL